ncbi:MAG: chromosome segregation protein SMC [Lachnospiraceae bacterium]|nr:chromosome segregation protein SMC [Lachnospiraceae bacterium]
MYLKSIEVQGFKSFANRILFDFHNGITAIVGPNGSGKSNVADAVRWVFGEQSAKQLRGSNMQDVIFAGTELRKPQSFASVKITLSNEDRTLAIDYDTVSVTRKVFRSGESEYMINDNPCRLRDIMELFYDTGIGKEGYSIIGQGQIDKILSGKADDRRELFDEAAGIVKFKKRKAAALKRLENERASMLRLTDILKELERQVGPLERQSETAKKYLLLRDELRVYDLNAFLLDQASFTKQLDETNNALRLLLQNLEEKRTEEAQLEQQYETLDEKVKALNNDLDALQEKASSAGLNYNDIEGRIRLAEEQIRSEEANRTLYRGRIDTIDKTGKERTEEIARTEEALAGKEQLLAETEEAREEAVRKVHESEVKAQMYRENAEAQHGEIVSLMNEKSETGARLTALETRISEYEKRGSEAAAHKEELLQRTAELTEELKKIREEGVKILDALREKRDAQEEADNFYKETQEAYIEADNQLSELSRDYQVSKSRLETLRNMAERYEGYNPAVRRLMDVRSRFPGMLGVVADLIRVEDRYRTAVETALGGSIQNIVTDTEDSAKALIAYLKENRAGRATFLPLESLRPSDPHTDPAVLKEDGVIGFADSLTETAPRYEKVVKYLLSRFLVVDRLDKALKIARKYRYSIRIVTLEGDFLAVGGSITGGAYRSSQNLLGRHDELDRLEERVNAEKAKQEALEKSRLRLRQQRDSALEELDELNEEISALSLSAAEKKADSDARERLIRALEQEAQEETGRIRDLSRDKKDAEAELVSIRDAAEKLEHVRFETSDMREESQKLLNDALEEQARLRENAEAISLTLEKIRSESTFAAETIERLKESVLALQEERAELIEKDRDSEEAIRVHGEEIEALKDDLARMEQENAGLSEALKKLSSERDENSGKLRAIFDERGAMIETLSDLNREEVRLESGKEKIEEKLDALTEYLWNEYALTPSEAEAQKNENLLVESPQEIRKKARELKQEIRALGSVNVNAIDEFKEIGERYSFMKTQYEDLQKAEKSLVDIVDELDRGMRAQFAEKFEQIRQEYSRVFKELFGGGTGNILLSPDTDIIDADISVISQPPGKKLQNMLQLSGGEKALSAIALIFAIQNLKPSPFCLLDEIEAALDESNVGRFTAYLKKLKENTQFILITHRRGTMTAADRLYGITMQEKGVSTMVSVNLVDEQLS